jgi:hypothetical protein
MAWIAISFAVFSLGFFAGSLYTAEQRERRDKEREAMREAAWRKRTA